MATATELKYLFTVVYKDGSYFEQARDDVSKTDPLKSAFFDVKIDDVKYFFLMTGDDKQLGIDLDTGEFSSNFDGGYLEHKFTVGEPGLKPYKLIFQRQHTHNFNIDREELAHTIKYCLGYTDGNNVEHKIFIE